MAEVLKGQNIILHWLLNSSVISNKTYDSFLSL